LASTPQGNNRFAALATTDDGVNYDDRPFAVVRSQRAVRASAKRQRQRTAQADQERQSNQSSQPAGRLKSRVITGQSSAASLSLLAAKKTIKKAVLCVDNVNLACNEDDIRAYVSSLGAPRRRPKSSQVSAWQGVHRHRDMSFHPMVKRTTFNVGQWVWYLIPRKFVGRYPKWTRNYDGPYLVIRVISPSDYMIQRHKRAVPETS